MGPPREQRHHHRQFRTNLVGTRDRTGFVSGSAVSATKPYWGTLLDDTWSDIIEDLPLAGLSSTVVKSGACVSSSTEVLSTKRSDESSATTHYSAAKSTAT
jgi:hypothetical protein